MKTITGEKLREIISRHAMWLRGEAGGERADLSGVTLFNIDLSGTNLSRANLSRANLHEAKFPWTDLSGADLSGADLRNADLYGAKLCGADLSGAKIDWPMQCPETGSFTAWKKCLLNIDLVCEVIVKLEIPEEALRSSATTKKCRASKAKVLSIETFGGEISAPMAHSAYNPSFEYRVGKTVSVDDFDTDRWNVCSTGIHFFMTREDAVNYIL